MTFAARRWPRPDRVRALGPTRALGAILAASLFAAGLVATPDPLPAQVHRITNPVDSYLWWTLSEDITPRELKRLYSDPALSLARYLEAVEAGQELPLSEEELERLVFYVNHELNPELAPMWWAFDIFARDYLVRRGRPEEELVAALGRHGVSQSGVDTILVAAHGCRADRGALMSKLGPKQVEAQGLIEDRRRQERAGKATGKPIMEDVNERRYEVVASKTGRKVDEVRELVDALADWEAPRRLVAACLPALKVQLQDEDWQLFRSYLREEIIAPLGGLPFFKQVAEEKAP